jgi:L-asparaginase II
MSTDARRGTVFCTIDGASAEAFPARLISTADTSVPDLSSNNPVLVEALRGDLVESAHRGAVAVLDADGVVVLALGEIDRPIFPRSAIKGLQALPLIESGAADGFGLVAEELALACASHSGEPDHARVAASMLAKAGRGETTLECGAHWPMGDVAQRALAAAGVRPGALHNNCSGKHAGFVCLACGLDEDPAGYVGADHRVQREVRATLIETTGDPHLPENRGIDGCSIPTYAVPLRNLALAFARFGTGHGFGPERARAAQRLREAVAQAPFMVAGTGRFDTVLMEAMRERAFVKVGAEGVYCAALPELGYGVALKIEDGAGRAAEVAMAAIIERLMRLDGHQALTVDALARPTLRNWNGIEVGAYRPAGALA